MSEKFTLQRYLPEDQSPIEIRPELAPVIERISQRLPHDFIRTFYISEPGSTNEVAIFPYFRVDGALAATNFDIETAKILRERNPERYKEIYQRASRRLLGTIAWVDIGFEGLDALAKSPASKNWTAGAVGHHPTNEQRAQAIMTDGAQFYVTVIQKYQSLRRDFGIEDDAFTIYNAEDLLFPEEGILYERNDTPPSQI